MTILPKYQKEKNQQVDKYLKGLLVSKKTLFDQDESAKIFYNLKNNILYVIEELFF